jgi:periplasmic glucans biosynthesis protein
MGEKHMTQPDRRSVLLGLAAGFLSPALPGIAAEGLELGEAAAFSFGTLIDEARTMAASAYRPPPPLPADVLDSIDYDAHGKIRYKPDFALWARTEKKRYPATFFHLGRYFKTPVRMFVVEKGTASEIIYADRYFDMPADSPAHRLPKGAGFAGFRFQESRHNELGVLRPSQDLPWQTNDWVAFLGASYFRAIGDDWQYGLSARGVMIDAAEAGVTEEFPAFTRFYLEQDDDGASVIVHALLDGPSISGAYRFVLQRGGVQRPAVLMDVKASLFLRKSVRRLGLMPLTSMYWYSETRKATAIDWRPEVHDSDGLMVVNGAGEQLWRPLNNPPATIASSFSDKNPRGFGLMQRDRAFDHYMDGVFYDRRPSLWVEPLRDLGEGAVQLIEIPTDDEIHDNIVAAWVPAGQTQAGQRYDLAYRLFWQEEPPVAKILARCVATRLGNGGQPGTKRPKGVRKFMIEFLGGPLETLPSGVKPEIELSASRGTFSYILTEAIPNDVPGHWRTQFDLTVDGTAPVEMRAVLKINGKPVSETWLYQYHPF